MADCKVLMDEEDCPMLPTLLINIFSELEVLNKISQFKVRERRERASERSTCEASEKREGNKMCCSSLFAFVVETNSIAEFYERAYMRTSEARGE